MPKFAIGAPALPKARRLKTAPKPFKFKIIRPVGAGIVARAEAPGGTLMEESMVINGVEAQSVNEWYIYKALTMGGIPTHDIDYQVPWHGGRSLGGQVLDFVVTIGGLPFVIRVMGKYWHSEPITSALDTFTYGQMVSEGLSVHDIPDTAANSVDAARHALIQEGILR